MKNKGDSTEERRVVISAIRDWRRGRDFYFADSMIMSLAYFILRRLRQSRARTTPPRTPGALTGPRPRRAGDGAAEMSDELAQPSSTEIL
jgi:hypothetical protein